MNSKIYEICRKLKNNPTRKNEEEFINEFKNIYLISPILYDEKIEDIKFITLKDFSDNNYFPAFFDEESFEKWKNKNNEIKFLKLDYKAYFNLFKNTNNVYGLSLDPLGVNLVISDVMIFKMNKI